MYKVFINDKVICFTNNSNVVNEFTSVLKLNFYCANLTTTFLRVLGEDNSTSAIVINVDDFENAFEEFKKDFNLIDAAGGLVENENGKKLFIYRLDKWDLPKGKIERGEGVEEAAVREVEEECGIDGLVVEKKLIDTYHIYKMKSGFVLKQTYWFMMTTNFCGELVPQLEEDITRVEWLDQNEIDKKVLSNTYPSILELLRVS